MGNQKRALEGLAGVIELQIGVFGLGFVGLTSALGFAEKGFRVKGFDVNQNRLDVIAQGKVPFLEPGLDGALNRNSGTTFFPVKAPIEAAKDSDIIFFCVGTPCGDTGEADLTYLFSALDSILPILKDGKFRVLVIKSTIPPGTTQNEIIPYLQKKGYYEDDGFAIVNNPEFLREGKCWEDFINPDRIVCGVQNKKAVALLQKLYDPFQAPLHIVSLNTGEYIKYLSNTLLASLISYSNEMSMIADGVGNIDTGQAFRILHEDKRLRGAGIASYIFPGCGYGGYCLPKDTQAMAEQAKRHGVVPHLLEQVISINNRMPLYFVEKIKEVVSSDKAVGILGLSFKPDSDDVRDSPAAKIITLLLKAGYKNIHAYDPVANSQFDTVYHFQNIQYCSTKEAACQKGDVVVLITAWSEFKDLCIAFPDKQWIDCRYFLASENAR